MRISRIGFVAAAFLILAVGQAAAKGCSSATLNGIYGAVSSGDAGGPNSPTSGLFKLTIDGAGHVTGTGTQSDNGTIEAETFTGTYTVAKDCTGTMALIDQTSIHADYNFVLDEKNNHFEFIRTDTGFNEAGEGAAIGSGTCSLPKSASTIFGNRLRELGSFPVDIVGQITLDGAGKASANETFALDGEPQTAKMKGTYAIASNCTGTITLKIDTTAYHFAVLAVDGGQTLQMIEADPGVTVVGTAQAR